MGWSTKIPNHDVKDVLENVRRMIREEEPVEMNPSFKNFRGTITKFDENRYVVNGEIAQLDDTHIEITELPVKTWTDPYKTNVLEVLLNGKDAASSSSSSSAASKSKKSSSKNKDDDDETAAATKAKEGPQIKSYKDHSTDETVRFVVEFPSAAKMQKAEAEGMHKFFKCQTTLTHENTLTLFDHNGCLQRYKSTTDILKDFFGVRMQKYVERKEYLIGLLTAEFDRLANQVRFIQEICDKKLVITNKKRTVLIQMMKDTGYAKDPLRVWKHSRMSVDERRAAEERENEESNSSSNANATADPLQEDSDSKAYNYLLGQQLWSLTRERKEKLEKEMKEKQDELEKTKNPTKEQFWLNDLEKFEQSYDANEVQIKKLKEEALTKINKK